MDTSRLLEKGRSATGRTTHRAPLTARRENEGGRGEGERRESLPSFRPTRCILYTTQDLSLWSVRRSFARMATG